MIGTTHAERLRRAACALTGLSVGDGDTICAIAGGIVACSVREEGILPAWLLAREPLPIIH